MTKLKFPTSSILGLALSVFLFACNNSSDTATKEPEKAADTTATTSTTATTTPAPAPAMPVLAAPFDMAEMTHKVKDYATWRPFFNSDSANRTAAGLETLVVGRGSDNTNDILIAFKTTDQKKAKDFAADPKLKDVMAKAGVMSKPDLSIFHVTRFNTDSHEKQWVVVTHKVKDYAAWEKVYDAEGKEKRAAEGMVDVLLAQGADDPNLVQLVFDVTDMAKAKAAINSAAKKKTMMDAGVQGKPSIHFYTSAD